MFENLIMELLFLADQSIDILLEAISDQVCLVHLPFVEYWVISKETEGIHGQI